MGMTIEAVDQTCADALADVWRRVRGRRLSLPRTTTALSRILAEYFGDTADRIEARTLLGES
jgi:hypothetical protein